MGVFVSDEFGSFWTHVDGPVVLHVQRSKLWAWFMLLSLAIAVCRVCVCVRCGILRVLQHWKTFLCNHPKYFIRKLQKHLCQ